MRTSDVRAMVRRAGAISCLFACTLALFGAAGTAAAASRVLQIADASTPPVTINSCGPILDKTSQPTIAGIPIPAQASTGIQIEFVNETNQTATLVNFNVKSGGDQFVIRDVGTFSPGVSIKHKYRNGEGQAFILPEFIAPKVACEVASVKFADGSVWEKGQAPTATQTPAAPSPQATSPLSVTPASLKLTTAMGSALFLVSSSAKVAAFKETDDCAKTASVFVAATSDASASFSVKPLASGSCTAHVTDEGGDTVAIPIVVQ
jgi:hypothetical protein